MGLSLEGQRFWAEGLELGVVGGLGVPLGTWGLRVRSHGPPRHIIRAWELEQVE